MRNRFGFSLMELTVTVGVMAVVSLGVSQVMTNMYEQYKRARLTQTLDDLHVQIMAAIQGGVTTPNSWTNTLIAGPNAAVFTCILNNAICPDDMAAGTGFTTIELRDASNAVFIPIAATAGFDIDGQPCNTFDGSLGNRCMIHFTLSAAKRCTTGDNETQCNNPVIQVQGIMSLTAGNWGATRNNHWDFTYSKAGANTVVPVVLAEIRLGGGAGSTGACSSGGWIARGAGGANLAFRAIEDPSGAVSGINTGTGDLTFQPGNYTCNVTMPAYQVNGFKVRVLNSTSNTQIGSEGSGYSPVGTHTTNVAQVSVSFGLASATNIRIQMFCENNTPDVNTGFNLAFGMWGPTYSDTQLTVMSCMRRLM